MSRVGKKPILIPSGVEVSVDGQTIRVKGPKGELVQEVNGRVQLSLSEEDGERVVLVSVTDTEDTFDRAQWGTARALVQNMVQGVTEGFSRQLEVIEIGRAHV